MCTTSSNKGRKSRIAKMESKKESLTKATERLKTHVLEESY